MEYPYKLPLVFLLCLTACFSCQSPENQQERKLPKHERVDLAFRQYAERTKNPKTGVIPRGQLRAVYEVANGLRASAKNERVGNTFFQEKGPNNVGGRTRTLMYDPNDAGNGFKKVWAGSVSGGLWYNSDISDPASTWQAVDDLFPNLAITTLAYEPSNTQNFYAGTGEGWFNSDAVKGFGIYKSTNAGQTWASLPSTLNSAFDYVQKIVVTQSGAILAGTKGGGGGMMRSTDGGATWSRTLSRDVSNIVEGADGTLFATTGISNPQFGFLNARLYRSVNDGLTWQNITPATSPGRIEIACAPSDANIIYAVCATQGVSWLKKSTDKGNTWSNLTIPKYKLSDCTDDAVYSFAYVSGWYALMLSVHPTNPDLVTVGGLDLHRSTDGGQTWAWLSNWRSNNRQCTPFVHADQHVMQYHPTNFDQAIFGNDGGVFISSDVGDAQTIAPSFHARNKSYNVTQFYTCAYENTANSHYFLGGTQDNGTQQFDFAGISSTKMVVGGDGGFCHIDEANSNLQIASIYYNNIYRSLDGGQTFYRVYSSNSGRFINPSDYDSQTKTLYCASNNNQMMVFEAMDSSITGALPTEIPITTSGSVITHIRVSDYTPNRIFVGSDKGEVFRIDNAQSASPTITNISNNIGGAGNSVTVSCIEIGSSDDSLLVTYSNYGVVSVWESYNAGQNWTNREGNLPDMPINWALYNPSDKKEVLLATEAGVWVTENIRVASPNWLPVNNNGLANVRTDMMQLRKADSLVIIATHGRGLYTSSVFQVGNANLPEIRFVASTTQSEESNHNAGLGCREEYADISLELAILGAPNNDAEVLATFTGSATNLADYEILTPMPIVFEAGKIRIPSKNQGKVSKKPQITYRYLNPEKRCLKSYHISLLTQCQMRHPEK